MSDEGMLENLRAPDDEVTTCLAIGITTAAEHVALIYEGNGDLRRLHLAFHRNVRDEVHSTGRYYWVKPRSLEDDVLRGVSMLCHKIARSMPDVPFGIDFGTSKFVETSSGTFELQSTSGTGLTCATFIQAVFRSYGMELILTHPGRIEDEEWRRSIVSHLRTWGYADQADDVENMVGEWWRVTPADVASSGLFAEIPVAFTDLDPVARALGKSLGG